MDWFGKSTSKTKRGQPRRRVKPLYRRPLFVAGFLLCLVGSASVAGWWVWQIGWVQQTSERAKWFVIAAASKTGFSVREIFVDGRFETSRKTLLKALRLERGAPILAFNPEAARARVEALPWVRKAVIERQLPDVVHLLLRERRPMALWQRGGKFSLIDTNGELIPLKDVSAYTSLIVIIGRDAPGKAAALFEVMATEPKLASRVKAAVRVGGRRWNLHLSNDIEIRLPEEDANAAWNHLAKLDEKHDLLSKDLITVDLRLADRVVIREGQKGSAEEEIKKLPIIPRKPAGPRKRPKRQPGASPNGTLISGRDT
jgi:cell division protein FtsQ